ncbi:AMP-binding protein [Antrihabitans sp. YC2-6]|uniref:AMP-binding protein n=1 Tax=Antrihabitans sp. YC2-6 TaxID=2799498 RepID=UPI0018F2EDF0|nr:AMP-binding protein [Antrihabitans sp. YC2-6]MBJ8344858.1 AMP-binding protein [Antrihabitans sp. YC2-6]
MYALVDSPVGPFIHIRPELLTETAAHDPFASAISDAHRNVTNGELDSWSDRLAQLLADLGAGPNAHVVMAVPASIETVVAMWAVAKTGAALASIDPTDPEVLAGVGADWRIAVGITTKAQRATLPNSVRWLVLDDAATLSYVADFAERAA